MTDINTIILCAGSINYSNLPIGTSHSNAMIPVNGKPVIGWILDDLLKKNIYETIIVLHVEDARLKSFLRRAYQTRMKIEIVEIKEKGTILNSLQAGLSDVASQTSVRLILGDTLIRDSYEGNFDFVYVGIVPNSQRWCLVNIASDNSVISYINKKDVNHTPLLALVGYYHFLDGNYLVGCLESAIKQGCSELSDVLEIYGVTRPIQALQVKEWYDFGSIDNLVAARQNLLQSRYFNSLEIDPIFGTITKRSYQSEKKLLQELYWYLHLPDNLRVLTPRIIEYNENHGQAMIKQEYYGYPTLAELALYSNLSISVWQSILSRLFQIHEVFCKYTSAVSADNIREMYIEKTLERIKDLRKQGNHWEKILSQETILLNNTIYLNYSQLTDYLETYANKIADNAKSSIIHGDFCFSNILFDLDSQLVRLIDPRGSFGDAGIYGDPRYDIAKLRHSVCGLYDYIVADMFDIKGDIKMGFFSEVYAEKNNDIIERYFDQMVIEKGYNLTEICFIEALLFISMVPLHSDNIKRQIMMYLTGIKLLNEVYYADSH
jgi:dTDP-glucose pyrophosphorylase